MKVELNEQSKMGEIQIISDTTEEVDEFLSEINEIKKLTEDNINFYIDSIQKQSLIENISKNEENIINNMLSTGINLMKETLVEYIENYDEVVIDLEYDYDERIVVIEHLLYVAKDRIIN